MITKDMKYKASSENVKRIFGDSPKQVTLYTINQSVARSGLSAVIKVIAIVQNTYTKEYEPVCVAFGRVHGCGLDRGFEACYNLFCYAYPGLRYQDVLRHNWI